MIWFVKSFIKFCKRFINLIKLVSTLTCSSARVRVGGAKIACKGWLGIQKLPQEPALALQCSRCFPGLGCGIRLAGMARGGCITAAATVPLGDSTCLCRIQHSCMWHVGVLQPAAVEGSATMCGPGAADRLQLWQQQCHTKGRMFMFRVTTLSVIHCQADKN